MPSRRLPAALLALALAACTSDKPPFPAIGPCAPTAHGTACATFPGYDEARAAFARASPDGAFIAVLEDVAWLRFEGAEEEVLKAHRAYFEQGYTTFQVSLFTKDFTQPTAETFILQDSRGARLSGKPVGYRAGMEQEGERFANRFSVSFRHAITTELDWVRLTRVLDGSALEWVFREKPPAAPGQPAGASASGARPENLLHPRHAAPETGWAETGRPVNLLRVPGGPPGTGAAPSATSSAAALPSVGEPAWSDPGATAFPAPAAPPPVAPAPAAGPSRSDDQGLPPPTVRSVR